MFNDINISFPLQKIDKSRRIVTGIATADNIDLEGDMLTHEASLDAFSNWIGNIREMHDRKAVGTLVDWRPTTIMHNGVMQKAIEVDVYISKGAEDTWQKILDKTLKGFSIGGKALEKSEVWDERTKEYVTQVTKYMLGELSVVDNPCNPAGMFMLIKRAGDGSLVASEGEELKIVYYCSDHKYATIDNIYCPECSKEMNKIGFVEEFNADVINKVVSDFELAKKGDSHIMELHEKTNDASISNTMNDLTDTQKTSVLSKLAEAIGIAPTAPVESPTVVPNVTINITKGLLDEAVKNDLEKKAPEVEEVETVVDDKADLEKSAPVEQTDENELEDEMDLEKVLEGFGASLLEKLDASLDSKLEKVKTDISAEVDEKISTIEKSVGDFKEETAKSLEEAGEELEKVASSGALKKSVDVDEEVDEDELKKSAPVESFWGGIWVDTEIAHALGYES